MLSELPRQIWIQLDEGLESQEKFICWHLEHVEHILYAQITDVFGVQVDQCRVDEETFEKNFTFDDFRHLLLAKERVS